MELHALELALLVVGLVDRDDDRRRGPAQELGRLCVGRRHAARSIDHEDDDVGVGDRDARLLLDPCLDGIVGILLQATGVDHDEPAPVPVGVAIEPVTGGPGAVLDDGGAPPDDAIEQRALADVGTADDGHHGQGAARPVRAGCAVHGRTIAHPTDAAREVAGVAVITMGCIERPRASPSRSHADGMMVASGDGATIPREARDWLSRRARRTTASG